VATPSSLPHGKWLHEAFTWMCLDLTLAKTDIPLSRLVLSHQIRKIFLIEEIDFLFPQSNRDHPQIIEKDFRYNLRPPQTRKA
jgi:hypothetical protein